MLTEKSKSQGDLEMELLAEQFTKSFNKFSDIEGAIIRGHILIEQALNHSIELTILHKNEYNADKFSFAQKVQIASIIGISDEFKVELNALNKLRNQIAHSFKYDEKYIEVIINNIYHKNNRIIQDKTDKLRSLTTSISFICGAISYGYRNAKSSFLMKQIKIM